ncbi:DNA topoisomerase II [Pseudoscourfieldia marina]
MPELEVIVMVFALQVLLMNIVAALLHEEVRDGRLRIRVDSLLGVGPSAGAGAKRPTPGASAGGGARAGPKRPKLGTFARTGADARAGAGAGAGAGADADADADAGASASGARGAVPRPRDGDGGEAPRSTPTYMPAKNTMPRDFDSRPKLQMIAAAQVPSTTWYKTSDAYADIRSQTRDTQLRLLVDDLGLATGPATLHAVVALGKFAFFAYTRADGAHGVVRLGGWQQTCFGHVPFVHGAQETFQAKLREGHDVAERWLVEHSPFVYPYGRREHGNDQELNEEDERKVLPIWTACIIIKVTAGGGEVTLPIVFGGGDFKNEMANTSKPYKFFTLKPDGPRSDKVEESLAPLVACTSPKTGVNREPFSREEDAKIIALQREFGNKWSIIAHALGNRSDKAVQNRWNVALKPAEEQKLAEDGRLENSAAAHPSLPPGVLESGEVAAACPNLQHSKLDPLQQLGRDIDTSNVQLADCKVQRHVLWTDEEDSKLRELVQKHGAKDWRGISLKMGVERDGRSCRSRWLTHLATGVNREPFSRDEDAKIIALQREFGNKWSKIAHALGSNRSDKAVQNRWNNALKPAEEHPSSGDGKKTTRLTGIPKLDDANDAGGRNSQKCTLILTEGDSAKSLAVSGLGVVGRDHYGVFPLRGKLLNVREATHTQVMANAELNYLKQILGLKHGHKYEDTKSLR